jgi:hypothetical protein
MSEPKRKPAPRPAPAPEHGELDPDDAPEGEGDAAKSQDPDGRTPPDHQRDALDEGRTPEQKVVERAREQQSPPLNPDTLDDDRAREK